MFALVKYLQGPIKGNKQITSCKLIKNFNPDTYNNKVKYEVEYNKKLCVAQVIAINKSKDELRNLMKHKRLAGIPQHLLDTNSEDENGHLERLKSSNKVADLDTKKSEKIKSLLKQRLDKFDSALKVSNMTNDVDESASVTTAEEISQEQDKQITDADKQLFNKKNEEDNKTDKQYNKKSLVKQVLNVHCADTCESHCMQLKLENEKLKKNKNEIKERIQQIIALKNNLNEKLKLKEIELQEKEDELRKPREINEKLADSLADKYEEDKIVWKNIASRSSQQNLSYQSTFLPIAFKRANELKKIQEVHLGRDIWITEKEYNGVINTSKTPRQIACNILLPVFDEKELLTCTITGYSSGRSGNKKQKVPKLDEKKIGACSDFYEHWIKTTYADKIKQINESNEGKAQINIHEYLGKFFHYAGKKLSEMKASNEDENEEKSKKKQQNKFKKSEAREKVGKRRKEKRKVDDVTKYKDEEEMKSKSSNSEADNDETRMNDDLPQNRPFNAYELEKIDLLENDHDEASNSQNLDDDPLDFPLLQTSEFEGYSLVESSDQDESDREINT